MVELPRHRAPRQARSRRTLDRLLNAAEAMIEDRTFESATVAAIVRRGRSSVGTFYARFGTKEALLAALFERFETEMLETARRQLSEAAHLPPRLAPRAAHYVDMVVTFCLTHRGVLRARMTHYMTHEATTPGHAARSHELVRLAHDFFAPCHREIRHSRPDAAIDFALQMVDAVASLRLLSPAAATRGFAPISQRRLRTDLSAAMLGYLLTGTRP